MNINYARAKKNLWKNFWLISCWLNTALILFLEILTLSARHMGICSIAGMIVYTLLLLLLCIFCMIKLKKIDRSYAQKRNLTSDENDDRNWIGGILYYNPSDPHTMVEQRVGIGTTIASGCVSGAKVVRKADPYERVGALCLEDGKPSIIEYYELTPEMAEARDERGTLLYGFGVILNYVFRTDSYIK